MAILPGCSLPLLLLFLLLLFLLFRSIQFDYRWLARSIIAFLNNRINLVRVRFYFKRALIGWPGSSIHQSKVAVFCTSNTVRDSKSNPCPPPPPPSPDLTVSVGGGGGGRNGGVVRGRLRLHYPLTYSPGEWGPSGGASVARICK